MRTTIGIVGCLLVLGCSEPSTDSGAERPTGAEPGGAPIGALPAAPEAPPEPLPAPQYGFLTPPGMDFPHVIEPACPGEGCSYGEWLACDTVPVYARAGDPSEVLGYFTHNQAFEVSTGAMIIERPGVVAVTDERRAVSFMPNSQPFVPGDTLFTFDYLGEGFFNVWFEGSMMDVESFWPWPNFFPGDDYEFGGEVVQEGSTSFWVQGVGPSGVEGWVWVDSVYVAAPNAIDPDPPVCR